MQTIYLMDKQEDGNDQAVQTQYFSENENQNHTDEQTWLLCCTSDTGIAYNADGKTGSQSRKSDR